MAKSSDVATKVFDLMDSVVEVYLGNAIKPFLAYHEKFYSALNRTLRHLLDTNKAKIPEWFTANFITYARTIMVIPCLLLLAGGHTILPSLIVLAVDFGDFLDGVVARFWVDQRSEKEKEDAAKEKPSTSPAASDDDSFEVVTTGSPQNLTSWVVLHRNRTYGGFVDAVCDKAFVVPCWIALLHSVVSGGSVLGGIQYATLILLILAETASGTIRFRAYFSSGGMPAPKVEGFDFSTSAVKADHVGKAKQTFEMVGTALFVIPVFRYFGLLFLLLALPLAYESVRRKVKKRVIYVNGAIEKFDYRTLKFWMQAKALGSKLVVGIPGKSTDMVLNACASSSVDEVVAEAPSKADVMFLEKQGIDYVVSLADQTKFVTDEVFNTERCLVIGDDGVARLSKPKEEIKKE